MAEGSAIPAPTSVEEPYEVRRLERRTPTIVSSSCIRCATCSVTSRASTCRALLEAELEAGARRSLTLIFSACTEADVFDRARFESWQAKQPAANPRAHERRSRASRRSPTR